MLAQHQPEHLRARARNLEAGARLRHILEEEIFRSVVIKERNRSDRSNQPFSLVLLDLNNGRGGDSSAILDAAIAALVAVKRDIDIVGWFEWPALIGVIVPEIRVSDPASICEEFDTRFRRELAKRLDEEAAAKVSIRLQVYPELRRTGEEGPWPVNPFLYPERRPLWARGTIYDAIKRGIDVIGSLALLVVLSPFLLLIAIFVKSWSRGSVIFSQVRIGQMMKPFTMFKFRTMHSDADQQLHHEFVSSFIKANGHVHKAGKNAFFKLTDDPRVTSVGRMLRKTSLDELPQLWNVLRGDMSLVGPRPPLPYEIAQYQPWHRRRVLEAKPGLTGLWQVAGRSRTTFDEMVRLDLRYAKARSLSTDVKILLATPAAVISRKGAC